MKTTHFNGKVCWVTGASSGIGEALVKALSLEGASVIISARNESNLNRVKSQCKNPEKIVILPCDMETTHYLPQVAQACWDTFHNIDYVFLNAGIAIRDTVINTETNLIRKVMNTNFLSAAVIARTLLPAMVKKGSGHLVVTSSLSGKYGIPKLSAYAASKHALHGFFESLRAEHVKDGIKVTMVIPGLIRTGITLNALKGDGKPYGKMMQSLATGMSPDECAEKILKGVLARRNEVIVGRSEKTSLLLNRLFPSLMARIIANHPLEKLRRIGLVKKQNRIAKE